MIGSAGAQEGGGRLVGLGEHRHLDGAGHVLQGEEGHPVAALGRRLLDRRDVTEERDARAVAAGSQLGGRGDAERLGHALEAGQRVARDVEAEDFLLVPQALIVLPLGHDGGRLRLARRRGRRRQQIEERGLALGALALLALAGFEREIALGQQVRAGQPERVERAGLDQALDHAPVDQAQVDAHAEVLQRRERAVLGARLEDRLHRGLADVLDGGQAEPDRVAGHAEAHLRGVDVGRLHADAHRPAFLDVLHDLVGVAHFRRQQGRHELDRVVGLEVGGLIRDEPVGRGVRVVHGDAVGDEVGRARDLDVVGRLRPLARVAQRRRPDDRHLGQHHAAALRPRPTAGRHPQIRGRHRVEHRHRVVRARASARSPTRAG